MAKLAHPALDVFAVQGREGVAYTRPMEFRPRRPALPSFLERRHTDEFAPPPYTRRDCEVIGRVARQGPTRAIRLGVSLADY